MTPLNSKIETHEITSWGMSVSSMYGKFRFQMGKWNGLFYLTL